MPVVRAVLFDFHETLVTADRWMAMETGGIAVELLEHLGVWDGDPPADGRQRAEQAYAHVRAISAGTALEYPAHVIGRVVLDALGVERQVAEDDLSAAVERLFRSYLPDVTVKPRVPETLDALAAMGLRMGIVSNAAHAPFITWALDAHALRHHFEQIVVSADVGVRKPRREIFDATLDTMGLTPADAVYVGNDYVKDVMGAKLAGLRAVWMPEAEAQDYRAYTPVHPDAIADRFDRLPGIIAGWGAKRTETAT